VITLSRTQLALVLVPLVVLLTVAGSRIAGVGASQGPETVAPLARAASGGGADVTGAASHTRRVVVHVVGAVRRAGLFRLPEGARVADALVRAGGPTRRADLTAVNLASPLVDGQQIVVPLRGPPGSESTIDAPATGAKVSLASATLEQLDELPGIGPVTAQKIVDWRATHGPFRSVEDLDDVPGIGPARIEQLRDLVTP
jgi:competence protein ComEA